MAETVYKKISELTSASIPLAGTEYIEVSATGASKKALFSGIFGVGWWAKLMASFSAFKAPDADHADDADTLEGESASDLHDATALVGAVPLANIPAELTGKNASTVGGYSVGVGAGKINPIHGNIDSASIAMSSIFSTLAALVPNVGDIAPAFGSVEWPESGDYTNKCASIINIKRYSSTSIYAHGLFVQWDRGSREIDGAYSVHEIRSTDATTVRANITY
jgi:hypothetical protein